MARTGGDFEHGQDDFQTKATDGIGTDGRAAGGAECSIMPCNF